MFPHFAPVIVLFAEKPEGRALPVEFLTLKVTWQVIRQHDVRHFLTYQIPLSPIRRHCLPGGLSSSKIQHEMSVLSTQRCGKILDRSN